MKEDVPKLGRRRVFHFRAYRIFLFLYPCNFLLRCLPFGLEEWERQKNYYHKAETPRETSHGSSPLKPLLSAFLWRLFIYTRRQPRIANYQLRGFFLLMSEKWPASQSPIAPLSVDSHIDFTLVGGWERLKPQLLLTHILCPVGKPIIPRLSVTPKNAVVRDKALPRSVKRVFPDPLLRNALRLR